ncbi:MFS transporter [Pseudonocardia alaniniphila]|uniref:MFS transporter n=1 Tax=Pseudonocardia alaniniphila TaxID=75291 RepID=A0ABS9TPQ5_9PSEU|nr:MFS transporter [Pseudonocardia alaniniphila]MCH6170211.1 MFS transporter [Pseudonocardia alaniniphila]
MSPFQYVVISLCGLVMLLDGFDTQAISYAAPLIAHEWHLPAQLLGPIFSSALVGLMVGYLLLSPLSDRLGHKRMIVGATVGFAGCTLAAAWAGDVTELIVLRFCTGLALGAACPSCVALTGEFSPKRLRATLVLVIYSGFVVGIAVAGVASGWLLPAYGWRSMFWAGGLAPLVLVVLLLRLLPESPVFMIKRGVDSRRILRVLRRMDRSLPVGDTPTIGVKAEGGGKRTAPANVFTENRMLGTFLLWILSGVNIAEFYSLQSWLPTIMSGLQFDNATVVTVTTFIVLGGLAATVVTGPAMGRIGPYATVAAQQMGGFLFVALTGLALRAPLWLLLAAALLTGACIVGGMNSLIALTTVFYPASVRSTGVGWALGVGRVGGILGPLVIGAALTARWPASTVICAMGVPMIAAALAALMLARRYGKRR